jgi:UDP-glucose 4-epimerase
MTQKKVVLITGVAGYWGAKVAKRLIAEVGSSSDAEYHVIGLDAEPPEEDIPELDFIQADIRNPLLVELLASEQIHTVCHLVFAENVRPNETTFDLNVMGAMKLLGACAEAGVRKAIIKSSMMVYGAHPNNPTYITEQHPIQGSRAYGYTRDLVEIEAFCNGLRRQVPEMMLTVLRFSSIVGPKTDTPLTRFLKEPLSPVLLGFDPLMQVIHEDDVVEALVYAILNDVPGVFNVAAEGILPLSRLVALAAKVPIPVFHLFAYWGSGLMSGIGLKKSKYLPIELDYLRYPWVGDLAKMEAELGFVPRYTAEEALREFAGEQRVRRYMPDAAARAYDEERLRDTIERRRRARQRETSKSTQPVEGSDNE